MEFWWKYRLSISYLLHTWQLWKKPWIIWRIPLLPNNRRNTPSLCNHHDVRLCCHFKMLDLANRTKTRRWKRDPFWFCCHGFKSTSMNTWRTQGAFWIECFEWYQSRICEHCLQNWWFRLNRETNSKNRGNLFLLFALPSLSFKRQRYWPWNSNLIRT